MQDASSFSRRSTADRCCAQQQGFTLIEVLVAIVVFSFGLLGMVGMQAFALQANREARMQSQATSLARELAEMMRGNKQIAVQNTLTANPYLGNFSVGSLVLSSPGYCLSVGSSCATALDVANAQMTDWLTRVDTSLPGARVSICFDSTPYDSEGLPQWACNASDAGEIIFIKIGWTQNSTDRSQTGSSAFTLASGTGSRPNLVLPITSGSSL